MEKRIASYQEPGIRLQLIKIYRKCYDLDSITQEIITFEMPKHYEIRKNRKILYTLKWETPAKQKFNAIIQQHLLQTKLEL